MIIYINQKIISDKKDIFLVLWIFKNKHNHINNNIFKLILINYLKRNKIIVKIQ